MSDYLNITPQTEDYLRPSIAFENLTYNTQEITNLNASVTATTNPFVALDGCGLAYIQGEVTIASVIGANQTLCTLPIKLVPARDTHAPICVLRSGAYVANAVKINTDGTILLKTAPQTGDIVCLDNLAFLVNTYN